MRVEDVEPMLDMYRGDGPEPRPSYMKPFGVKLIYQDGHSKRFTDLDVALCAELTKRQRTYIENLKKEITAEFQRTMSELAKQPQTPENNHGSGT